MGPAIGDILPLAIGVAISPVPIIAIVLMLATPRARTTGIAFTLGWVAGLALVAAVVLLVESGGASEDSGEPATWASLLKLAIGALFVLLALKQWQGRQKAGEEAALPKWMQTIDTFGAGKSLGLGALLSGLNPKNLGLTLGAALAVAQAGLTTGEEVATMVLFAALGSATILAPARPLPRAGRAGEGDPRRPQDLAGRAQRGDHDRALPGARSEARRRRDRRPDRMTERRETMSQYEQQPVSGWALGGIAFAGTLMIIVGAFQAIAGLVAIFDDEFYVIGRTTPSTST
jgi:threonine/homoserine/homoserine lactone efflux protein